MLQNIYKILEIPETDQKELNEALKEIINNNLFADVVNGLNEEQKNDLKNKLSQTEDKEGVLKSWLDEHKVDVGLEDKVAKSVEDSLAKFINKMIEGVSEPKKQQVLDYMKGIQNA